MIEALGYIGAFTIAVCGIPQIAKIVRSGSCKDLSFWYFFLLFFGVICLAVYTHAKCMMTGTYLWGMQASNVTTLFISGTIIIMKITEWRRDVQER